MANIELKWAYGDGTKIYDYVNVFFNDLNKIRKEWLYKSWRLTELSLKEIIANKYEGYDPHTAANAPVGVVIYGSYTYPFISKKKGEFSFISKEKDNMNESFRSFKKGEYYRDFVIALLYTKSLEQYQEIVKWIMRNVLFVSNLRFNRV